jgi:tetratricopeptide (TPR) repeat protein
MIFSIMKNVTTLETAVNEIKQACRKANDPGARSPFFFLVGSGISHPSVPTSGTIQTDCEEKARCLGRSDGPPAADPLSVYSHWFRAAFPHRVQRQQYLRGLIEHAPITHANLRLAHLLINGAISNIVVTTNFDDLLSRALTLFGKQHITCDDPHIVDRIDPEEPDIQLIHVHGSYWFYDCRNTTAEIQDRALPQPSSTMTMAAMLDKLLASRAPLVCGYSGWENDVVMGALKRRLCASLPYNMYWFCYRAAEMDSLPPFLDHPDVYFVLPEQRNTQKEATESESQSDVPAGAGTPEAEAATLSAITVFDELIRGTGVETPRLTNDPLKFFADQLKAACPQDDVESGRDIYAFRSVIERVSRAIVREDEAAKNAALNETQLERVREAVRGARYQDALTDAQNIELYSLDTDQLRELVDAMEPVRTSAPVEFQSGGCDIIVSSYRMLHQRGHELAPLVLRNAALTKGNILFGDRSYDGAVRAYDIAISALGEKKETTVERMLAVLRNNKGLSLRNLGQNEKAVESHKVVIEQLGDIDDDDARNLRIVAFVFEGQALVNLKQYKLAVEAFESADRLIAATKTIEVYTKQANELSAQNRHSAASNVRELEEAEKAAAEAKDDGNAVKVEG